MSEYYSRERGGKEEEEELSRVADTVTVYNPAAAARATGQDLNQQVKNPKVVVHVLIPISEFKYVCRSRLLAQCTFALS